MMRNAIIRILQALVLIAVASSLAHANDFLYLKKKAAPAGGGTTYLIKEDFEGTGYDGGSWTEDAAGGTINPDYTTAPLVGSQSLQLISVSASWTNISKTFTAQDEVWAYAAWKMPAEGMDFPISFINGGTTVAYVQSPGSDPGAFSVNCGGSPAAGSATYAKNTLVYLWFHYKKGTGADAVCDLYTSANETKPGAADASRSDGTSTLQAVAIKLQAGSSLTHYLDKVRVKTSVIGSTPD